MISHCAGSKKLQPVNQYQISHPIDDWFADLHSALHYSIFFAASCGTVSSQSLSVPELLLRRIASQELKVSVTTRLCDCSLCGFGL